MEKRFDVGEKVRWSIPNGDVVEGRVMGYFDGSGFGLDGYYVTMEDLDEMEGEGPVVFVSRMEESIPEMVRESELMV